tara:strand:+ start:214 stop:564 length:351 start_codon:yes stop_codon:yes gene_type:complete
MGSIYLHNSRCAKSRQGMDLLKEKGIQFSVQEYLKDPLTKRDLESLYILLKKSYEVKEFTRIKEKKFKEMNLSIESFSSKSKWCKLISNNPILLERPILYDSKKAIIGRPPENLIK